MPDGVEVVTISGRREELLYAAHVAMDRVVAWMLSDGFTPDDIRDRCEEAIESAQDAEREDG